MHLGGTIIGSTDRGNPTAYPVEQLDGTGIEVDRTEELVQMLREVPSMRSSPSAATGR